MKFIGPLIISIIIGAVAITAGATYGRNSWSDLPEKSDFNSYILGRELYGPTCGIADACHETKDLKEYSRDYMQRLAETESLCPENDLFQPYVPPELEDRWNDMEDFEEANRQEEEYVSNAHRNIGVFLVRSASETEAAASEYRNWKHSSGFKYVKFTGYEEGIKTVNEKKLPYILEISLPFDI